MTNEEANIKAHAIAKNIIEYICDCIRDHSIINHDTIAGMVFDGWLNTEPKAITEADYTEEMRQLNEEWKENLEIQRQMLIDKAKQAFENAVGWCKTYQWYQGVYERFQKDIEK